MNFIFKTKRDQALIKEKKKKERLAKRNADEQLEKKTKIKNNPVEIKIIFSTKKTKIKSH